MGRYTGKTCRLSVMLSLTFSFFLVEIIFGYLTNSMALVADSFHMLSDVVALIIAFFCMKISKKRSSTKNTFGWVRAEVLGALINAVFLIALCFSIFIEALKRLIEPEEIHNPLQILIVGVLGLLVNIIGIFMFHGHASIDGHSHARPVPLDLPLNGANGVSANALDKNDITAKKSPHKINGQVAGGKGNEDTTAMIDHESKGKGGDGEDGSGDDEDETAAQQLGSVSKAHNISFFDTAEQLAQRKQSIDKESAKKGAGKSHGGHGHSHTGAEQLNMHGVFLHILGDAFGSIIVIINAIICWQVDNDKLKLYLDPSLSLVMAMIIFSTTLPLFKESALILLQTVPNNINVEEIKKKLLKSIDGVLAVHEFHVWRLAGNKIIATAHIRCRNLDEYMKIAESVKQLFHHEGIHSTTIQPEFDEEVSTPNVDHCVLECPQEAGQTACAPSKCCSAKSAPILVVTTDPATSQQLMDKASTVELRPISSTSGIIMLKDKSPSPGPIEHVEETETLLRSPEATDQNSVTVEPVSSSTSSSATEDDRYKGVPPILYYNKGYAQLGKENKDVST